MPDQLVLTSLLVAPLPPELDRERLRVAAARELDRSAKLQRVLAAEDPKLKALETVLVRLRGRKVLIFTEYRDTAVEVWRALRDRWQVGLIHGGGAFLGAASSTRRAVIERFAPLANHVGVPPAREQVQLLIATDVLSEGLNLQDAAHVVSYDLPWNPVRVMQRVGRIDRLGSPHPIIQPWYFAPDPVLDRHVRVLARLRSKLRAISSTVGRESSVLASDASVRRSPLEVRLFHSEERLRAAWLRVRTSELGDTPTPWLAAGRGTPDPAARALVVLELGGQQRFVLSGDCAHWEDDATAAELLLLALGGGNDGRAVDEPLARSIGHAARGWLDRRLGHRDVALDRSPSRRLLELLQSRPGGPTAAECQRAERILHALAGRRPPPPPPADADFDSLAGHLERWAEGSPESLHPLASAALLGVLLLDPGR